MGISTALCSRWSTSDSYTPIVDCSEDVSDVSCSVHVQMSLLFTGAGDQLLGYNYISKVCLAVLPGLSSRNTAYG